MWHHATSPQVDHAGRRVQQIRISVQLVDLVLDDPSR
jgi:hypothetical protein